MRLPLILLAFHFVTPIMAQSNEAQSKEQSPFRADVLTRVGELEPELIRANQDIWAYAELGLDEHRSAARLVGLLKKNGFRVREGVSSMPTAFVAEYGAGKPIIGILAEYDALPELSQEVVGSRTPASGRANGHGCGHSALGVAAVGAALAAKEAMAQHKLPGTIRVYGTPAEETLIGKVYMTRDGLFDDLDVCLHWHPGTKNRAHYGSSKALISAKFTFTGLPAHASGSPDKGKSALDGVELMNVGVNYMREHVPESTRVHHVITNGGGQPNVVPAEAQVWYFVRANSHEECGRIFDWVQEIAAGAAKMSRTTVAVHVDTDCHEIIPNLPLTKLLDRNLRAVGPPPFTEADARLAKELQAPLRGDFGLTEDKPLHVEIEPVPNDPEPATGGSTDVGDISWKVPTGGINTACFALGSPGHSWQNVAAIGSPIGHKGMIVAAKTLGLTLVDLLQDEGMRQAAKFDFDKRMKGRTYTSRIPKGQAPPKSIR